MAIEEIREGIMKQPIQLYPGDAALEAFSRQAKVFDDEYGNDGMIRYKRRRVRDHMLRYPGPGSRMLELNCGTGEDAMYFAGKGFHVHATDLSSAMLERVEEKMTGQETGGRITTERCSFHELENLQDKGPFDHIYSNFGGLNCTGRLDEVLRSLPPLLKPGGTVTLVIISKFCLWEFLLLFKGRFKTAFRRFLSTGGRKAHIEGTYFKCWYYTPRYIRKHLGKEFEQIALEGLCTLVPPSYVKSFDSKHPKLFRTLSRLEEKWKSSFFWRSSGDYFIISLRKV
jgi:ubiquinone/menaquinone biosynthesis C-methylase UbiE